MNPLKFPQRGPLWRETPASRAFFYTSLEFLNKRSPNKKKINFTLLSKVLGKERSPTFPKTGPLWKQTPISKALLGISVRVPSKGALPLGSPHRAPTERERETPFPEPSFIHPSESPVCESPSRFSSGAPVKSDANPQSLPLHILQGSQ